MWTCRGIIVNMKDDLWMFRTTCKYSGWPLNIQVDLWMFRTTCECSGWPVNVQDDLWMFRTTCECSGWPVNVQDDLWMFRKTCECSGWPVNVQDDLWMFRMTCEWSGWPVYVQDDLGMFRMTLWMFRMTWVDFVGQIGGVLGLCIGFSFLSGNLDQSSNDLGRKGFVFILWRCTNKCSCTLYCTVHCTVQYCTSLTKIIVSEHFQYVNLYCNLKDMKQKTKWGGGSKQDHIVL